jgi:hypothetical protein
MAYINGSGHRYGFSFRTKNRTVFIHHLLLCSCSTTSDKKRLNSWFYAANLERRDSDPEATHMCDACLISELPSIASME